MIGKADARVEFAGSDWQSPRKSPPSLYSAAQRDKLLGGDLEL